jgi:N-methylhydantoinase B
MGHMSEGAYRVYMEVVGGGWGSCASADGADLVDCPLANCSNIPVESLETDYPFMRVEEYGMRRGSAGAGAYRGGLGAHRVYRILDDNVTFNCYSDRFRIPPWGLFEGEPGKTTEFVIERDGERILLPSKANVPLRKGDLLRIDTAGGGGYGDPRQRPRELVLADIANGYVTEAEAREVYGLDD